MLHFLLRARCVLIWFRHPPLHYLRSSVWLRLRCATFASLAPLRWLRLRRPYRLLKSPYLTPWSERSGDRVRVALIFIFLARLSIAGFTSRLRYALASRPVCPVRPVRPVFGSLRAAPLRWLRPASERPGRLLRCAGLGRPAESQAADCRPPPEKPTGRNGGFARPPAASSGGLRVRRMSRADAEIRGRRKDWMRNHHPSCGLSHCRHGTAWFPHGLPG